MSKITLIMAGIAVWLMATPALADSYESLSPGNQLIVDALYEGQTVPESGTLLNKDQISFRKSGTGWGRVFMQLKLEGYYPDYKNLGLLIKSQRAAPQASNSTSRGAEFRLKKDSRPTRRTRPTRRSRSTRTSRVDRTDRTRRPQRIERPQRTERPSRPDRPQRR